MGKLGGGEQWEGGTSGDHDDAAEPMASPVPTGAGIVEVSQPLHISFHNAIQLIVSNVQELVQ